MITFVLNYLEKEINVEIEKDKSILYLKNKIIETLKLESNYIDINIKIDIPIRCIGKFNLESGFFPRTFDNYTLDRWNLEEKRINIEITEIYDYKPNTIPRNNLIFLNKILNTNKEIFDINSELDFPPL
tara:strand:- start:99 stop:485 length:387 start_codon:yes stop_codon:yes gene_type:complete